MSLLTAKQLELPAVSSSAVLQDLRVRYPTPPESSQERSDRERNGRWLAHCLALLREGDM